MSTTFAILEQPHSINNTLGKTLIHIKGEWTGSDKKVFRSSYHCPDWFNPCALTLTDGEYQGSREFYLIDNISLIDETSGLRHIRIQG